MRRRSKYGVITINTDVDIYLEEIDTDDLIAELTARGKSAPGAPKTVIEIINEALAALEEGDARAAMDELRKALKPHDPAQAYEAARTGNHPFLTVRPQ